MSDLVKALPAYFGGKRRLCRLLFALLATAVSPDQWGGLGFIDPFLGGGSVSLYAKSQGFHVRCNDIALRSAAIGHALIANSDTKLSEADVAPFGHRRAGLPPRSRQGRYSPRLSARTRTHSRPRPLQPAEPSRAQAVPGDPSPGQVDLTCPADVDAAWDRRPRRLRGRSGPRSAPAGWATASEPGDCSSLLPGCRWPPKSIVGCSQAEERPSSPTCLLSSGPFPVTSFTSTHRTPARRATRRVCRLDDLLEGRDPPTKQLLSLPGHPA